MKRAERSREDATMHYRFLKRMLDLLVAVPVLVASSPVMLLTALAIKLESPGPAVFRQTRLGSGGKEFTMYKFRSMTQNAEHTGSGVYSEKGDSRVTKVGRMIRATSIDELPQLFNIIKGDMSLIGPRPPLTYHPWPIDQYSPEQHRMFDVRPGVTGWAQVNGRKCVEWHERIEMNVWYVDHCSLKLDLKILGLTFKTLVKTKDNVNHGETIVSPAITGK